MEYTSTSWLDLINDINKANVKYEKTAFDCICNLSQSFMDIYRNESQKLPYHVNVIDLLSANENAHSKILHKLLLQNNKGRYEILESFVEYLKLLNSNFDFEVKKPQITVEKERIDILITDRDYAIIIENKVHNAIDQMGQLGRYIDIVLSKGYNLNQIYVLYLPRDDNKSPEEHSWGKHKEEFVNKYLRLSYRNHITEWLRESVLPDIKHKDIFLRSCIEQYIDHLDGLFSTRKTHDRMNKELQKHIAEAIGLTDSNADNHILVCKKIDELEKVKNQLIQLKQTYEKECWREWQKKLTSDYPNLEIVGDINAKNFPKIGVKINKGDISFAILIEKDSNIYYGIGRHYSNNELNDNVKSIIKPLLKDNGFKETKWWYGWKYTSFKNGYIRLKDLIDNSLKLEDVK